jgi:putative SOS response-associated peptidase YedK
MCNLYSQKRSQAEIRDLAKAMVDTSGNLPSLPAVFPDQMAPVVMTRPDDGQQELLMVRWAFPGQPPLRAPF